MSDETAPTIEEANEAVTERRTAGWEPSDVARVDAAMERWKDTASDAEMDVYRPTLMPSASMWAQITRVAEDLSKAVALPVALRGKAADIALVLLVGRDIGVGPTTAINRIHVIEGRPTMAAELMRALIIDRGHDLWFEDVTPESVTICAHRSSWPPERVSRVTWTMDMARTAGLASKEVWKKYGRSMLKARATSEIARDEFPDVLLGVSYTPEELGAEVGEDGEMLRVDSSAWSENSPEAPIYEPAPQVVIDAFLAKIDGLNPEAKVALAAKWKQLHLRPLKPTGKQSRILAVDEIGLADVAIAEVERDTPAEAEIVDAGAESPSKPPEPETALPPVDGLGFAAEPSRAVEEPRTKARPRTRSTDPATDKALQVVDDLQQQLERTDEQAAEGAT